MLCSLAVGVTWFCSDAASALEVGPVSVQIPPAVTVTVPTAVTVGPVSIPVSQVAPGLGASVTVSPQTGVGVSGSLPSSIGPVPVLPGAPHTVQVGLGPGGPGVALPAGPPSATGAPTAVALSSSPPSLSGAALRSGATAGSRARAGHALVPSSTGPQIANPAQPVTNASPSSSPAVESQPDAVDASLQQQSPGGVWSLLHDLASAHALWIALLLLIAIARFAAGGLLHDAFRRRAHLSST
jgi:hypothetical protein